jgi:Flp pilus assembly protein TadD
LWGIAVSISKQPRLGLLGLVLGVAVGCNSSVPLESNSGAMGSRAYPPSSLATTSETGDSLSPLDQARQLERSGKLVDAIHAYIRLAESRPNDALVWHRLAVTYDKVGQAEYAGSCYERSLQLDPQNAELWTDFGYGKLLRGDLMGAEQCCRQAIWLNRQLARAHNNLGIVLAQSGNSDLAIEQFRLAGCDTDQAHRNLQLARNAAPPVERPEAIAAFAPRPVAPPANQPLAVTKSSGIAAMDAEPQAVPKIVPARENEYPAAESYSIEIQDAPVQLAKLDPPVVTESTDAKPIEQHFARAAVGPIEMSPAMPANRQEIAETIGQDFPVVVDAAPKLLSEPIPARPLNDVVGAAMLANAQSGEPAKRPTISRAQEPKTGVTRQLGDMQ